MLLLNYKPVLDQPTGIGVYANGVLPAFNQFDHAMVSGGGQGGSKERLKRLAWSQFQLPKLAKKRKADLIFTPAPEGYLGKQVVPQVVMVHDLRPLTHPERSSQSLYFRHWVPPLLKQCRHILTNSEFSSLEIQRACSIDAGKITVIPLGFDTEHFGPSNDYQSHHHRPYLLHVGQAYPHKNLQNLIQAFSNVAKKCPDIDLILVGKPHPKETDQHRLLVDQLGLHQRVLFRSYISYQDLPDYYRGALALIYPSYWEGFGLPILEAFGCGTRVVTTDGSGMKEVAGDYATFVDPYDLNSLEKAMIEVAQYADTDSLKNARINYARSFTWSRTQALTRDAIAHILSI